MTNSKEDIMNMIYNLLVNPEVVGNEREVLLRAKHNIGVGKDFNSEIYSLLCQLKYQKSGVLRPFLEQLSVYVQENPEIKKHLLSKKFARVGVIFFTINSLYNVAVSLIAAGISIEYFANGKLTVMNSPSGLLGLPIFDLFLIILTPTILIAYLVFDWFAYAKIDKKHGIGWSIYFLIRGILGLVYIAYNMVNVLVLYRSDTISSFWGLGIMLGIVSMACYLLVFHSKRLEKKLL